MKTLALFLIGSTLVANEIATPQEIGAFRREEELIAGLVSPVTGHLVQTTIDLIAHGCESIPLKRTYQRSSFRSEAESLDTYCYPWSFLPHLNAQRQEQDLYLKEQNGMRLFYRLDHSLHANIFMISNSGSTNTDGEEVSSFFDYRMVEGKKQAWWGDFWFRTPQGIERFYSYKGITHMFLMKERLLNGKILCYNYKGTKLTSIEAKDPKERFTYSKLRFAYNDDEYLAYTDAGSQVHYTTSKKRYARGKKCHLLTKVDSPFYSQETITYDSTPIRSQTGRGQDFEATYEGDQISVLRLLGGQEESVYQISYKDGTEVITPAGTKIAYTFTEDFHPNTVNIYDETGVVRRKKSYAWYPGGRLRSIHQEGLCKREYHLDLFGNPVKEILTGDLCGEGKEDSYVINRKFPSKIPSFLALEEITEETTTTIRYLPNTNLITFKVVQGKDGHFVREYRNYDDCYNLIEIVKEADNERHITRFHLKQTNPGLHLPEWVEKFYVEGGVEKSLGKSKFSYNGRNLISDEEVYDAQGAFAYRLHKEYNDRDQLILETNPLGQLATYVYDDFQRLISHTPFSEKLKETREYDQRGRLISKTCAGKTSHYEYDKEDNLIVETNSFGQKRYFSYDLVVKKPKEIVFGEAKESFSYDGYGRMLSKTDALGRTTYYQYNAYDAVTVIRHPDGAQELFRYYINGKLKEHTDTEGFTTQYVYDSFGRVTSKRSGDREEKFIYNALHLLSHTDSAGYTTHYSYDGAGRKVKEEKCGRVITYTYDNLGGLATVTQGGIVTSTIRDYLGRVILETKNDLFKKTITYDSVGNEEIVTVGEKREEFTYDAQKRLIKYQGPLGEVTTISYTEEKTLEKRAIDPSGLLTIELYDIYDRLVEKRLEKEGILSRERFIYDLVGNLLTHEEDVFVGTQYQKTLVSSYTYDVRNRRISSTVSNRTTTYTHTSEGKVATKQKHDGTVLTYSYTPYGEVENVHSSKGDIDLHFVYDASGRLVKGDGFTRKLDPFGNIIEESFGDLSISKTYDDLDRIVTLTLPGLSPITYSYDLYLRSVEYEKQKRSCHLYTLSGDLLEESFATYTRDAKGQIVELTTPHFTQTCKYDSVGNPLQIGDTVYTYDSLSQLTSEKGPFHFNQYRFNSHYEEPHQKERLEPNDPLGKYDSLERLIECNGHIYTYDALGRRLSNNQDRFLYSDLEEVACYKNQKPLAVKIGPPHRPAFFLLEDILAIPLYDAKGALKLLLDAETHEVSNSYLFDAFGNPIEVIEELDNPWKYALKHHDPESGLIYFGKRYYNPTTKQWITEDPAGDIDTFNLYAFVRNNPLRYVDYTGLLSEERNTSRFLQRSYRAFTGAVHGVVDVTRDYVHNWESSLFYLGADSLDLSMAERSHMIQGFYRTQENRTDRLDNWLMYKFSIDPADRLYNSFRLGTQIGIEVAGLVAGGYGAFRGVAGLTRMPLKASTLGTRGSAYQGYLLNMHLQQLEKHGVCGHRILSNGRVRYYGKIKSARVNGEMAGRRMVREWNPRIGSKRTWHETLDQKGNIRILRPEKNDLNKVHYIFDDVGNFIGTR